ncbi:phage tail tape measure C-terminal domain-containing protein [uncultured Amaricoccus sp.]|uniref:phage tail tape measure C-terminal domain-containing protein n=1 Tax=uncultured Amaricoccus sp. TaxID=339341 RepID=UPI0026170801|nr:phage tail tape measure C-terminal domain-containing protein [uncultured Amaricoccus sp.]
MVERKVSVRIAAVGGDHLKADLVAIGRDGKQALREIEQAGVPASRGLTATGGAAGALMTRLDVLARRAGAAANSIRRLEGAGAVVARIDRSTGVGGGMRRDAADIDAYGRALDDLRAKHNPLFAAIRGYRSEVEEIRRAHAVGAITADEMNAAIGRTRQASLASIAAIRGRTTAIGGMARGSREAAWQQRMLFFQLNDIGVSLASGQSPLTVLVQQGSQITQMYAGAGGVNAALRQTGGLVRGLGSGLLSAGRGIGALLSNPIGAGVAAAVALAAAAFAGLRHEINETADVQVGFGDTMLAVWQATRDGAWDMVKPTFDAIATWAAPAFEAVSSAASAAWDGIVTGVHLAGNAIIKGFQITAQTVIALWAAVPAAIGAAVVAGANAVLAGLEMLINRVSGKLNEWIGSINGVLGQLPDWVGSPRISQIPAGLNLGRIDNAPAADLRAQWAAYQNTIGGIVAGDPLGDVFGGISARAQANARRRAAAAASEDAAGSGGGGGGRAGGGGAAGKDKAMIEPERELAGIAAITDALNRAYDDVKDLGKGIGEALGGAFKSAEDAVGEFVKTGKLDIRSLVTSTIADFAQLGARKFLFAPLSNALSTVMGGFGGGIAAAVQHSGGPAGAGPLRLVEAAAFAHAPRLHNGGRVGPDEYAAILQSGERVLNRRQTREWESGRSGGAPVVNFNIRDAQSFRQSRTQIAADVSRAVALGRRGM